MRTVRWSDFVTAVSRINSQSVTGVDNYTEMKFTVEQHVFVVKTFAREKTYRKCVLKFCRKYPDSPVPTKSCVSKLVKKLRATGSVCDKKEQSKLKQPDYAARNRFCKWLLQNVHDGIVDPQLVFMTDEAWFHVSDHVSAQNIRIWSGENPHTVQQVPLHSEKMGYGVL
jgi:hypothetical protein